MSFGRSLALTELPRLALPSWAGPPIHVPFLVRKPWPGILSRGHPAGQLLGFWTPPHPEGRLFLVLLLSEVLSSVCLSLLLLLFTPDVSQGDIPICGQPCKKQRCAELGRKLLAQCLASWAQRRSSVFGKVQTKQTGDHFSPWEKLLCPQRLSSISTTIFTAPVPKAKDAEDIDEVVQLLLSVLCGSESFSVSVSLSLLCILVYMSLMFFIWFHLSCHACPLLSLPPAGQHRHGLANSSALLFSFQLYQWRVAVVIGDPSLRSWLDTEQLSSHLCPRCPAGVPAASSCPCQWTLSRLKK